MKKIYLFSTSFHLNVININSLKIKLFKPDIDFSHYDYFIITSKQVSEFLQQYEKSVYNHKSALCVSKKSALAYQSIGGTILDIGSGYGDNLVEKIEAYPKNSRWLYIRAKVVASNFVEKLQENGYSIDELIAYESDCSDDIINVEVEKDATLIFSSPSSVKCFLKNHTLSHLNRIIVIGITTARALPKNIFYELSQETTIESCVKSAL